MFTGLVQCIGRLRSRQPRGRGWRLEVEAAWDGLELGESVAVNGACLTVAQVTRSGFEADVSQETVSTTTLGALPVRAAVNLERAVRLGDRMGGHMVSGHVDAVTTIASVEAAAEAHQVTATLPPRVAALVAPKGSIALDGVSLTVNEVEGEHFTVMIVPHTWAHTHFGALRPGSQLNLEADIVARYVARLMQAGAASGEPGPTRGSFWDTLERAGIGSRPPHGTD